MAKTIKLILYTCLILINLSACQSNNLSKSNKKQADAKFSASVFLNNKISKSNQRIFVQIRNLTCSNQFMEKIEKTIRDSLRQEKFDIVDDPIKAKLLLQANIIQCNINRPEEVQLALDTGYGTAIKRSPKQSLIEVNPANKNNSIYSIIADLQISERTMEFKPYLKSANKRNLAAIKPWRQYQTRLAITKPLIKGKDYNAAIGWLTGELATSIAKIFVTNE
jgi:hypothetical protein